MFSPYNRDFKTVSLIAKVLTIFDIILLVFLVIMLIFVFQFPKFPEKAPKDIYITGLKSFSFIKNSEIIPYKYGISNLGKTSKLEFSCYLGYCQIDKDISPIYQTYAWYYNFFSSKINNIKNEDENSHKNMNNDLKTFYHENNGYDNSYRDILDYDCSKDCAINKKKYCYSCSSKYDETEGLCKYMDNDNYSSSKYCFAKHLILKWKGHLYSHENATNENTSYINSAVLPDEECPKNQKLCGILDNYGNKLCISNTEDCPINKIVVSEIEPLDYNYDHIKINDKSIYYTNEAVNDGIIVKNFYVDSDILLQYQTGCYKIDEETVEELIEDNENLYDKSGKSGKSYLKWCNNGYNKNFNLTNLKIEYKEYSIKKYLNENVIKKIQDGLGVLFIFGIITFLPFLFILYLIRSKYENASTKFYIGMLIFCIILDLFICLISSFYNKNLSKINDIIKEYESYFSIGLYKALVVISKAFNIINIIYLVVIFIGSLYYSIIHFKAH